MGTMRKLCNSVLASAVFISLTSATLYGQAPANTGRQAVVSDWTQRHLLYTSSKDKKLTARIQGEPRWVHNWYVRHTDSWWPNYHPQVRSKAKADKRDWSFALGTATFEPIFDFNFSIASQSGFGNVNVTDLNGGKFLATQGSLTVTGAADVGTYFLLPGGPAQTTSPNGQFTFDNQLYPTYPTLDPSIDVQGLLYGNISGYEINIWGNSAGNYEYDNTSYNHDSKGAPFKLNVDPGGGDTAPSKFVFDVNAAPNCSSDFVVMGIPAAAASGGQANIVGVNNLYSEPGKTGLCPTTGPTVKFSYAVGTGQVPASVTISQFGTELAFVENLPTGSSYFHVLNLGTTGSNGTSATAAAVPGTGNNAVDSKVLLSPDNGVTNQSSTTAPFVVYTQSDNTDVAYVTTYSSAGSGSGYLYKINGVFAGSTTPRILWTVPVTAMPSAPIYDTVSNKVFFTDSAGRIDYVLDSGSPSVVYGAVVAAGTTSENPVTLDSTNQMVYATFNSNGTNAIVVQTPTTLASSVTVPVGVAGTAGFTGPYGIDFNNAFYTGIGTPMMFVAGNGSGATPVPTLYGVGFTGNTLRATGIVSTPLATGIADSSAVTEFYNPTLAKDNLFVGVTNNCIATTKGGTAGCILGLDATSGFPTVNAATTALAAPGGTTDIIVDNDSSLSQTSSVYYATKTGATLVKATQAGLN